MSTESVEKLISDLKAFQVKYGSLGELRQKDNSLSKRVTNHAVKAKMSFTDYLKVLGFSYEIPDKELDKMIRLLKEFIEKHGSLDGLKQKNLNLYQKVNNRAFYKKTPFNEYLESLGFSYEITQLDNEQVIAKLKAIDKKHGIDNLHQVDNEFYRRTTPFLVIAWATRLCFYLHCAHSLLF